MKKLFIYYELLFSLSAFAQTAPEMYYRHVSLAEGYYIEKNYLASAKSYTDAFRSFEWKGFANDRYNAACSWAMAGNADSAFYNLERIVTKTKFSDYDRLVKDSDLDLLHADVRWTTLLASVKENKEKAEANLNKPLAAELDSIQEEDQKYRRALDDKSNEGKDLWKKINETDSTNLIRVREILDQYGWLGPDVVGEKGNTTLFLVIQHSDLATQEKYLPMMKEAVANKKARPADLALLVDRIEMRNGRPQIYGSQITVKDGKQIIHPIIDEKNVNIRRAEVGLQPLENYAKLFGIDYKLPK